MGSEIDFVDALMGGGFAINNPNVVAACGCGSSFQAKDDAAGEGDPVTTQRRRLRLAAAATDSSSRTTAGLA